MKRLIFYLLILPITQFSIAQVVTTGNYHKHDSIKAYVDFLEKPHKSAKDYIIGLFDEYDFVVFVERQHAEMLQYELLMDIFKDKRFQEQVGHIFHEIGGGMWDKEYNDYLHTPNLTREQSYQRALEIQRKMSWYPVWARPNYNMMLTELYEINRDLPRDKKLSLHPTDIGVDWDKVTNEEFIMQNVMMQQFVRDSVMTDNIMKVINSNQGKRKKYFAILNSVHGTFQKTKIYGQPYVPVLWYLEKRYSGKIANVLINMQNFRGQNSTISEPMEDGRIDAAFEYLSLDNVGFNFNGSPFADLKDRIFEEYDNLTLGEKYTGFVFYGSIPNQVHQEGLEGLIDRKFAQEILRRSFLFPSFNLKYPQPEDAFSYYNSIYNYKKRTLDNDLASSWADVMKWLLKPEPKITNSIFQTHEDSLSLSSFVEFIDTELYNKARKAGFLMIPDYSLRMKTTPAMNYYDGNYNIHYPYWHQLDTVTKNALLTISDDENNAKRNFGIFFNTYFIPHAFANYLMHVQGEQAKSATFEGEQFASEMNLLFWRDYQGFERHIKMMYEMAEKLIPKLKNPVPSGENEADWYNKNYHRLTQSADPSAYWYFQFSQFMKAYENENLKSLKLRDFLVKYKNETEKLNK